MRGFLCLLLASCAASAVAATADTSRTVRYGAAPGWVLEPPAATTRATPADAPARIVFSDTQVRIDQTGKEEVFNAYRIKVLKPEALSVGNIVLSWAPDSGGVTVHRLRILRAGQVIDVLPANSFRILQREGGLEQSTLDGLLTASLQVPGLQVGDELDFAATIAKREPAFGGHVAGFGQFPPLGMPGAFRFRLSYPDGHPVGVVASADLPKVAPVAGTGTQAVTYELRDPAGAIPTEGAPPRFNVRRLIEYSDFATWSGVSRQMAPSFDKAAAAAPGSPIHAEAAKIAAASSDPVERAQAALRLVQDQTRYVFVGLDGGNYMPASVDQTWARRYGDCKAKTALLIALLRDLKIDAEPVLVSSTGGDGTNERMPSPRMFDHVLVRAKIADKTYWLDGTRLGDRYLDALPQPGFRWALPLRDAGAELEAVEPGQTRDPSFVGVLDIDARGGFAQPAKVTAEHVMRGDEAMAIRTQIGALSAEDADRGVRGYWKQQLGWVEPDSVSWRYDDRHAALVFKLTGEGKPDWSGDDKDGRSLTIAGAGFVPPDTMKRPKDQDQTAAWAVEFPRYRCWATTIRLPTDTGKWRWTYYADAMDARMGGVAYWRAAGLTDGVMRTVMSRKSYVPEISPADATSLNGQIAGFNNNMSSVYQVASKSAAKGTSSTAPFGDAADWVGDARSCSAPPR